MIRLGFYHLTRTSPDAALPELLGRTLAAGERALVRAGSENRVQAIDKALWAADKPDWLPHGSARTGHAALQPIWITAGDDAPNGAAFLFLLDGADAPPGSWSRIFDLFDGSDPDAVAAARARWTRARGQAAEYQLEYWKQTERGWERS